MVASEAEKCDVSSKCRMAVKYGLPVVGLDYIWDCVQAGKRLPVDRYAIGGKSKALDFRSGKISGESNTDVMYFIINKQWEVLVLEQLTSRIEQAHNNRDQSRLR